MYNNSTNNNTYNNTNNNINNNNMNNTMMNNKKISPKYLKRKFRSKKDAIYHVQKETGWNIEQCVDYVYDIYDNDPCFQPKKENIGSILIDLVKDIIDEILFSHRP